MDFIIERDPDCYGTGNLMTCLPAGLDKWQLVDVTCVGDRFRKLFDPISGEVHDSEKYFQTFLSGVDDGA